MDKYENDNYAIETHLQTKSNGKVTFPNLQSYDVQDKKEHKHYRLLIKQELHELSNNAFVPHVDVAMMELTPDQFGAMHATDTAKMHVPVEKNFTEKMGTIDGLMSVYEKVAEKSLSQDQSGTKIKDFFDKYIFNTDESREVLHDFLNTQKNSKLKINAAVAQNRGR